MLAAFTAGELERDFVAVVRFQGPRANGMPELHKLTPPLGALQKQGLQGRARHRRAHERRLRARCRRRSTSAPRCSPAAPLGKVRDGDLIRLDAVAGTLEALVDAAEWAGARAVATLTPDAGATQRPRPRPRALRRHAPQRPHGRGGRLHMAVVDPGGLLDPLDLAAYGPVIPVIVIDQVEHAVPMARALVDGGVRVLEVTLRTPAALAAHRGDRPRGAGGDRRRRHAAQRRRRARGAGRRLRASASARATAPRVAEACRELGLPLLPGVATGERGDAGDRRRLSLPEVLSRHGGRRHRPMLKAWPGRSPTSPSARPAASRLDTRAAVPGAAERQGLSAARG